MKLLALAVFALAAAITFAAVVVLVRDDDAGDERRAAPTASQPRVSATARRLAADAGIAAVAMEERLRMAASTCDVLRDVGATSVASVCRFNIVNGDAWWDGMPLRQLREVADALIRATQ